MGLYDTQNVYNLFGRLNNNAINIVDEINSDSEYSPYSVPNVEAVINFNQQNNKIIEITEENVYIGDLEDGIYLITTGSIQCVYQATVSNQLLIKKGWLMISKAQGMNGGYFGFGALTYKTSSAAYLGNAYLYGTAVVTSDSSVRYELKHISTNLETTTNKVIEINENSTDEEYPSALAVYSFIINAIQSLRQELGLEQGEIK